LSLERISGPWQGLYVVAYTTAFEGLFYGYAKVCQSKPSDAWAVDALVKLSTAGFTDEVHALVLADLCGQAMVSPVRSVIAAHPWVRRVVKAPSLAQQVLVWSMAQGRS
jgi:hypothetical protein